MIAFDVHADVAPVIANSQIKQFPVLFSAPMIKAIMNTAIGKAEPIDNSLPFKCVTRRLKGLDAINRVPDEWEVVTAADENENVQFRSRKNGNFITVKLPYGKPGTLMWVRETVSFFRQSDGTIQREKTKYRADSRWDKNSLVRWTPSLHMPKELSRIWLKNTGSHITRLQNMSAIDCQYEGIMPGRFLGVKDEFMNLWIEINGADSWNRNPWVWVVGFKVISKTGYPGIK